MSNYNIGLCVEEDIVSLSSSATIYVPSTYNISQNIDIAETLDRVEQFMAELFGGFSTEIVSGGYVDEQGELIRETIYKVTSYCTTKDLENKILDVISCAKKIKNTLKQETVMICINSECIFV